MIIFCASKAAGKLACSYVRMVAPTSDLSPPLVDKIYMFYGKVPE